MIKRPMSHVLNEIALLPKKEQVEALRRADEPSLRGILKLACDPKLKFLLPEGDPPFKENDLGDDHGLLRQEMRRMYLFLEGGNGNLKPLRRERLWIDILEYVNPDDARLLNLVKDKKLPEGLTASTVKKAFPDLF